MQDDKTKVKTQGRKSIGFILVSWCWYGGQCFLEFVHIRKCDLYKFLLILSQWQWLIVFSAQNVRSAYKPEFFPLPCYYSSRPWRGLIWEETEAEGECLKDHTTTISDSINPITFLYYYLLLQQHSASAEWGTSVSDFCMDNRKAFLISKNLVPNELCMGIVSNYIQRL